MTGYYRDYEYSQRMGNGFKLPEWLKRLVNHIKQLLK
jgi:hypothetical protein